MNRVPAPEPILIRTKGHARAILAFLSSKRQHIGITALYLRQVTRFHKVRRKVLPFKAWEVRVVVGDDMAYTITSVEELELFLTYYGITGTVSNA